MIFIGPSQPAPYMAWAVAPPASPHCSWHLEEKAEESQQRTAGETEGRTDRGANGCHRPTLNKVRALWGNL